MPRHPVAPAALAALVAALVAAPLAAQQGDPLSPRAKGSPGAPVTVYEMSDFQCPYCRRHALETFPVLEREYVATGKVRWVFVNFPLDEIHPNATPAAELAACAGRQDAFWPVHDLLFRHQDTWAPLRNPAPFFLSLADSASIARESLQQCLAEGSVRQLVRDDLAGALRAGARSTPTFYIEGGLLRGAHPPEVFRPILDSIIAARQR